MTYPFVQAHDDYGPRPGPVLAFVIHMAEGGGTVGFLSRPNVRGVSVHYVIEYSGRIVQMLREDHASGSLNPREIRTDDGPPPFGVSAARACLGLWMRDPNGAVLSCEIEGFATDGPNVKQNAALVALVADLRTRYPDIGLLGHRDFQDYKPCPGAYIPWAALGGHGEANMGLTVEYTTDTRRGVLRFTKDTKITYVGTGAGGTVSKGAVRRARAYVRVPSMGGSGWLIGNPGDPEQFVGSSVAPALEAWPEDPPALDCADAIAADRQKAKIVYDA